MKSIIAAALILGAAATASLADSDVPNGIYVKGYADYTLLDNHVQQLCSVASIPRRDFLSATELPRAKAAYLCVKVVASGRSSSSWAIAMNNPFQDFHQPLNAHWLDDMNTGAATGADFVVYCADDERNIPLLQPFAYWRTVAVAEPEVQHSRRPAVSPNDDFRFLQ